ncbi:MAG: RagB/SusD family nutrient uptake outer membrane protein [Bacteroidota bacterium]
MRNTKLKFKMMPIFLVLIFGCTNDLEKDPIGLLTEKQVDTDPSTVTIESSVVSAYEPLRNTLNGIIPSWRWDLGVVFRNDIILQDVASGDVNKKYAADGDQAWIDELSTFNFTPENQAFNGIWVYDYEGISRSNLAIGFLTDDGVVERAGLDEARQTQLLSEAYFLRAYYYFDLVNNFGDVPLVLKTPDSFEEAFSVSVRAPATEVLDQVGLDLAAAKELATNEKFPDANEPWRVSKGAIIALQAKVALFAGEWTTVLGLINELEGLGHYSLNMNYFDSFDATREFAEDEVIFAYDHTSDENPRNGNGLAATVGWGFWAPTEDFLNAFEENDPRLLYTIDVENRHPGKLLGSTTAYKGNSDSPGNKVFIRYADVLLWKAEALNNNGDSEAAVAIVNQIRSRARATPTADGSLVPDGTLPNRPSGDQDQVREWIGQERRVELGWEGHRFLDLKRWETAQSVLTALGRNFKDFNVLYPIPQLDIDKSGGTITQNPGY